MKSLARTCFQLLLLSFAFVETVKAAGETFTNQFLGSPLLILVVLLIINAVAFLYHKIRK